MSALVSLSLLFIFASTSLHFCCSLVFLTLMNNKEYSFLTWVNFSYPSMSDLERDTRLGISSIWTVAPSLGCTSLFHLFLEREGVTKLQTNLHFSRFTSLRSVHGYCGHIPCQKNTLLVGMLSGLFDFYICLVVAYVLFNCFFSSFLLCFNNISSLMSGLFCEKKITGYK